MESWQRLRDCQRLLRQLTDNRRTFDRIATGLESEGQSASTVNTTMGNLLTDWASLRSELSSLLTAIPSTYRFRVKVGMPAAYDGARITASDAINGGYGTLRVRAAQESTISPFTLFQAGDRVMISDAEDPDYNGAWTLRFTPQALGSNVLVNTNFASNWTTTNWVVSGGSADHSTGNTSALTQAYGVMSGVSDNTPYLLSFTVSGMTAGSVTATFDSAVNSLVVTANGTYECIVYSESGGTLSFTPTSTFDGAISSPSLTPWTGLAFSGGIGQTTVSNSFDTSVIVALEER
jgi:hypothetical protein